MANGILSGHLVLYGRGDPTMTAHCFAADTTVAGACEHDPLRALRDLAEKLRQAGLREVEGDLIGDGSYFEPELVHGSWENDDLLWGYSAPVSGLVLNENAITLKIRPAGTVGQPAEIVADSLFPDLTFENRTQTVSDTGAAELELTRSADPWRMVVTGTVRLGARPRTESVAVPDPNQLAANAFRRLLAQAGIRIKGSTRTTTDSLETLNARSSPPLAEVESRPLSDWIFRLLSVSQNLYAELLAKQLGRQFGKAGSWKEGITVERRFLIDSVRVDSTQFSLYDGSGLSARDLVSPRTFVQLLRYMRQHPRYPVFAAGLPQGGISGTLRNRFQGSPLERRVRAKTGSIAAVNTLSGYLEAAGDSTDFTKPPVRIFSIQANHHTLSGRAMIQAIDSVVMDLWRSAKH
jgi:D-alanyl-D-alanine carboxypeptidase/D-alanyl-D-alanine-endopeptidase (penicillin-binding protein 4)